MPAARRTGEVRSIVIELAALDQSLEPGSGMLSLNRNGLRVGAFGTNRAKSIAPTQCGLQLAVRPNKCRLVADGSLLTDAWLCDVPPGTPPGRRKAKPPSLQPSLN